MEFVFRFESLLIGTIYRWSVVDILTAQFRACRFYLGSSVPEFQRIRELFHSVWLLLLLFRRYR